MHATVDGVLFALVIPMRRKVAPEDLRDELRAGLKRGKFEEVEATKVANLKRVLGASEDKGTGGG